MNQAGYDQLIFGGFYTGPHLKQSKYIICDSTTRLNR